MSIRASRVELRMRCRRWPGSASRRSTPGDSHAESLVVAGSSIVVGGVYGRPFANTRSRRQGACRRRGVSGQVGSCSRLERRSDEGNVVVALVDDPGRAKKAGGREGRETGATRAKESRRSAADGRCGEEAGRRRETGATRAKESRRSAEKGRSGEEEGRRSSAASRRGEEIAEVAPDHRPGGCAEAGDAIDPAATSSG